MGSGNTMVQVVDGTVTAVAPPVTEVAKPRWSSIAGVGPGHAYVAGDPVDAVTSGQETQPGANAPSNLNSLRVHGARLYVAGEGGALTSVPMP